MEANKGHKDLHGLEVDREGRNALKYLHRVVCFLSEKNEKLRNRKRGVVYLESVVVEVAREKLKGVERVDHGVLQGTGRPRVIDAAKNVVVVGVEHELVVVSI